MTDTEQAPQTPSLDDLAATISTITAAVVTAAGRREPDDDRLHVSAVLLAAVDRLTAAVVAILQMSEHHRVIIDHGLTRDTWLRAIAGRTGADAGMLLAAAERLADMPAVTAWFHQGALSWGAVRAIVGATRNLTADQRRWIDQTLHADRDRALRLDGDQVVAAVDGMVAQARPDLHADRETSGLTRRWLAIQPRLDGTADICGSLDTETAAAALAAFTTTTVDDDDAADPHDGDHRDRAAVGAAARATDADRIRAARRRSNVDIFKQLCEQRLTRRHQTGDQHHADAPDQDATAAGDADPNTDGAARTHAESFAVGRAAAGDRRPCRHCGAAPSTARPAFLVVADLSTLQPDGAIGSGTARLHWATQRAPVELTAAAAQRLACDATLRVVFTEGAEVLGVTAAHPKVSATLRAALAVRDGGCRFPGCSQPAELCDNHHVRPVVDGGPTELANLALICRDHHHAVHDGGWDAVLHADATMTFTRRGVTLTSPPRAHQHPRPAQPPPTGRPRRGHHAARRAGQPPGPPASGDDGPRPDVDPATNLVPF